MRARFKPIAEHVVGAIRAAAKLRSDRLVVTQLTGGASPAVMDAMVEGHDGVIAALSAPTLRQGLSRLVAQLVMQRPGLGLEAVDEEAVDVHPVDRLVQSVPDGSLARPVAGRDHT